MALQFSQNGEYYAEISSSGKLKVWNTYTNTFEREFTTNLDLASQCTCLHFIEANSQKYKKVSPKKKKRKFSETNAGLNIVLGTESGLLLVYSVPKANLEYSINSETSQSLTCLSSANRNVIYSGAEQNVFVWNLEKKKLVGKWKAGNERVSTILAIPESQQILIAAENITLWDVAAKEVLRTFTRHSSEVTLLHFIAPQSNGDSYFISGSKDDRLLNCWSLSKSSRDAIASFLLDDIIQNISVLIAADGSTNVAATVKSGVVHIYQHTLNGKCGKPMKPKSTIQIVSDAGHSKDVTPIRIFGAVYRDDKHLCIGHGMDDLLTFENISITSQKVQRLIRKDPRTLSLSKPDQNFKTTTPIVNDDFHYQTPQMSSDSEGKMKTNGFLEVSMETRLRNLEDKIKMSPSDNLAQLLVQGMHSKDKNILRTVLCESDEHIIENSVKQLPISVVAPLIQKMCRMISEENMSISSITWLEHILKTHADVILSHPNSSLLESLRDSLDDRSEAICLQTGANIKFIHQIESLKETNEVDEPAIEYGDSSDSDNEDIQMEIHSESENEWDEDSSEYEQIEENNEGSESEADSL